MGDLGRCDLWISKAAMYANKNREKELVPPDLRLSSAVKEHMNPTSRGDGSVA